MRCYFIRNGHIVAFEPLTVASDAEALEQARALFDEREGFHGFEVWDRARRVHSYPAAGSPTRREIAELS
jgi:hypothetical protein